ncbi:hypothetical protein [Streptomyces sp. NPDC054887]
MREAARHLMAQVAYVRNAAAGRIRSAQGNRKHDAQMIWSDAARELNIALEKYLEVAADSLDKA